MLNLDILALISVADKEIKCLCVFVFPEGSGGNESSSEKLEGDRDRSAGHSGGLFSHHYVCDPPHSRYYSKHIMMRYMFILIHCDFLTVLMFTTIQVLLVINLADFCIAKALSVRPAAV